LPPTYAWPVGRLARVIISGTNAWRLYDAKAMLRELGTYLTGDEATAGGVWDSTPQDFGVELVKVLKRIELDVQTDPGGTATVRVYTNQTGAMALQYSTTISTGGVREVMTLPVPPGIRGRLMQVEVSGAGTLLFAGRVWVRPLNDPKAEWTWADLPIEPTASAFKWLPFSVSPTPPGTASTDPAQWLWGKVLEVEATPNEWNWVDVPFEVAA